MESQNSRGLKNNIVGINPTIYFFGGETMRLGEFGREIKKLIPDANYITIDEYSVKLHKSIPTFYDKWGRGHWISKTTITGINLEFTTISLKEFTDANGKVRYSRAFRELKDE